MTEILQIISAMKWLSAALKVIPELRQGCTVMKWLNFMEEPVCLKPGHRSITLGLDQEYQIHLAIWVNVIIESNHNEYKIK